MVQLARKVVKNSFLNSSRALIGGIGGLAFSIALARLLSPELFGTSRMHLGKMNLAEVRVWRECNKRAIFIKEVLQYRC